MGLHLILGPAGSGKAGRSRQCLLDAAAAGHDAFLCVPGAVDRARFLRELAGGGTGPCLGVEVGTFDQLVARVAGSPPVRRTDRVMERIVVRDALAQVPQFAGARSWSGFDETARHHIDRLRRARAWGGDHLAQVERDLPGLPLAAWRQLEDEVAALLQQRRLRDDAWFERRAAAALRHGRSSLDVVVIYGFDALPQSRVELIERLASSIDVVVALAWRPGRRVHERVSQLRDRWRARGAFVEELDGAVGAEPLLGWLASELFEPAPAPRPYRDADCHASIEFVECCGGLQEAEEVVRAVAALHGEGMAWDDIVVASADASQSARLLRAAFDRAGIPARVQAPRHAIDIPAGRAVHDLLHGVLLDDPIRLVAALRHPMFSIPATQLHLLELRLRALRLHQLLHVDDRRVLAAIPADVRELVRMHRTGGDVVVAVRALLGNLQPSDGGELDLMLGIAALLDSLERASAGPSSIQLMDVHDAVARYVLPAPDRTDAGVVVVASLDDLRSVTFDGVVLHGMHLSGFRARVDDELDAPSATRDLLLLAVTRARRTLRIIRQCAGSDGGLLAPSPAWQELRRLLGEITVRRRSLGEVVVAPGDVILEHERAPVAAIQLGMGVVVEGLTEQEQQQVEQHRRCARSSTLTGAVADELAGMDRVSVTSIERYATCSARWFIEQRLRARDPDEDRSRLVEGELAHALLQQLAPGTVDRAASYDELCRHAREAATICIDRVDPAGVLAPTRIERVCAHVANLLAQEVAWEAPDRIDVERAFGSGHEDAIAPGLSVDGVEVVGRVDRVDHYGAHAVLHDYKYSSSDRPASQLIRERNLQLLVYWLALEQPGSAITPIGALYRAVTKGGKPSGVLAPELRVHDIVGPRAAVLDEDARLQLLDQAGELVTASIAGMRAGVVAPLTDQARCPRHCRLQRVCRVGEHPA